MITFLSTAPDDYDAVVNEIVDIGSIAFNFPVQLREDIVDEPAEMFSLTLAPASAGVFIDPAFGSATITILDNDRKFF